MASSQSSTTIRDGKASGWSIGPYLDGGWSWRAFGSRGSNLGVAASEDEARECAKRAYEDLREAKS